MKKLERRMVSKLTEHAFQPSIEPDIDETYSAEEAEYVIQEFLAKLKLHKDWRLSGFSCIQSARLEGRYLVECWYEEKEWRLQEYSEFGAEILYGLTDDQILKAIINGCIHKYLRYARYEASFTLSRQKLIDFYFDKMQFGKDYESGLINLGELYGQEEEEQE